MKKPIVYLGLSGGVDSAVAAALLLEKGYDVRGVFLRIWSDADEKSGQCPWVQERRDALAVAAKLGIPCETVDFEQAYREDVFAYFVREYKAGRTPNPDILCNSLIKFGRFLDYALERGADYIATGHHVRRLSEDGDDEDETYHLLAGVDPQKDQSYFLAGLNQHQLRHTLFPVGHFTKDEVREKARALGLPVADKRSTRGICFIGKVNLRDFLKKYTITQPGDIVDTKGKVIGRHEGVAFYTIGQRKGLDIHVKNPETKPFYVLEKDAKSNCLVVSDNEEELKEEYLVADHVHWLDGKKRDFPVECYARIRYRQPLQKVDLEEEGEGEGRIYVHFYDSQKGVASGQIVAFYNGEELIGSATIV